MIRALVLMLGLVVGSHASAYTLNDLLGGVVHNAMMSSDVDAQGFSFKVGDNVEYNINMGFISGTMSMTVKAVDAETVTLTQVTDLGFLGKHNCEMVIVPTTGETKSMVCDGKAQSPEERGDIELIESKEDTITVPAGTFTCLYMKAKEKKQNQIIQNWANMKMVPLFGMVKMIVPSPMGEVTIELKSYKRN